MRNNLHPTEARELTSRESHGTTVSLTWRPADDRVTVVVTESDGDSFELSLRNDPPLEVFYHPYAYAAFRGLELDHVSDSTGEAAATPTHSLC